jgi:hypothetical protein
VIASCTLGDVDALCETHLLALSCDFEIGTPAVATVHLQNMNVSVWKDDSLRGHHKYESRATRVTNHAGHHVLSGKSHRKIVRLCAAKAQYSPHVLHLVQSKRGEKRKEELTITLSMSTNGSGCTGTDA